MLPNVKIHPILAKLWVLLEIDFLEEQVQRKKKQWGSNIKQAKFKVNRVWCFRLLWKYLVKDFTEIIHLFAFGGRTEQILEKESLPLSSLQMLYFRNKAAWEVMLWAVSIYQSLKVYYYMVGKKKKKMLPTRWIFIFTSPKPRSASQSRCMWTSTSKENLFANLSWGQSTEDVQWMTSFRFTSSL